MLILSLIKRDGGTIANMGGTCEGPEIVGGVNYHFKPNKQGDHVCDVKDKAHVKRFLSIPEGFEPYLPEDKEKVEVPVQPVPEGEPLPVNESATPDAPTEEQEDPNAPLMPAKG